MQPVAAPLQARKQGFARPERRQQDGDRRLKVGEEPGDVGERFDAQQPLRLNHAEQHDEARREEQAHQHEDVPCAPGGKHVDEHERHRRPEGYGDDDEGKDGQHGGNVELRAGASRQTDADEHRDEERGHHPRRLADRAGEARVKQPARRNRRAHQQLQVFRQEERRERGDDAAEGEEREKREEEPGEPEPQEVVAELGIRRKLPGEPERSPEDRREHEQAHRAEEQPAHEIAGWRRRVRFRVAHTIGSSR